MSTIVISIGNEPVAKSKRAVSISKSGMPDKYDSVQWTTSDPGTFTIEFGSAGKSPLPGSPFSVDKNKPTAAIKAKHGAVLDTASKYSVIKQGKPPQKVDDPYIIIEL
jgi:hypothetical protein